MPRINLLNRRCRPNITYEQHLNPDARLPEIVMEGETVLHLDELGYIMPDDQSDQLFNRDRQRVDLESEFKTFTRQVKRAYEDGDKEALEELMLFGPGERYC